MLGRPLRSHVCYQGSFFWCPCPPYHCIYAECLLDSELGNVEQPRTVVTDSRKETPWPVTTILDNPEIEYLVIRLNPGSDEVSGSLWMLRSSPKIARPPRIHWVLPSAQVGSVLSHRDL